MNMASFKIEHYVMGAQKVPVARITYPLCIDVDDLSVLVVDDVSDTGDTFDLAVRHIEECGRAAAIRTAALHHKAVSRFRPDYYAQKVVKWRWIIYPWAVTEDLTGFIRRMQPRPATVGDIVDRLAVDHGIRVARHVLRDVLRRMTQDHFR